MDWVEEYQPVEGGKQLRQLKHRTMLLRKLGSALEWTDLADRYPGPGEIRVKVSACGVCRTDLHVVDGELPDPRLPIIPGHEIVGRIDAIGTGVEGLRMVNASAFPGSVAPAASAPIASSTAKIFVITHCSPASRAMAALRPQPSLTRALPFLLERTAKMSRSPPCSVPA
jgi:hypothetical protein